MNIEEQITLYPELTGEERASVEAYVAAHPEWKPALEEAQRWDRLLKDVRHLGQEPSGDEALAYYVVTRHLQPDRAPEAISMLVRRIEERIEDDPALASRVAEMESRLQAAEEGSPASEQFDRLMKRHRPDRKPTAGADSGRPGPAIPIAVDAPQVVEPGETNGGGMARERGAGGGRAPEGERLGGARILNRHRGRSYLWRAAAAMIALAALYGVLYIAGDLARPSHERIARFTNQELRLEGYESVRGDGSGDEPREPISMYLEALTQLREARRSFIGLFPTYNEARLDSAAALLNEVIRIEPDESFVAAEAAFLLGKTELARGNVEAAEQAFGRVIAAGGRKAPEARRILAEVRS